MIEPPNENEPRPDQSAAAPADQSISIPVAEPVRPKPLETAGAACLALARTGTLLGWGLGALGVVAGFERIATSAVAGTAASIGWFHATASAAFAILAYGLAGIGSAALARVTSAAIREYLERVAHGGEELVSLTARGVATLDRIAHVLSQDGTAARQAKQSGLDRVRLISEIQRAIGASQWAEAHSLLGAFAVEFPGDLRQAVLEAELQRARHEASHQHLATLEAAREVNDPEGVLESYESLVGSLEEDARAALDRDLAKWFLALIHRRLRSTKIQPEVVQLASRFAEAFASTVEGASVRAALPTLRRSVGLCPRCGSPYAGIGDACPKCLETLTLRPPEPDSNAQVVSS